MDFVLATEFQIEISEIMYEFREGTYKIFNTHKKCQSRCCFRDEEFLAHKFHIQMFKSLMRAGMIGFMLRL